MYFLVLESFTCASCLIETFFDELDVSPASPKA
jgi:hypothetical protein